MVAILSKPMRVQTKMRVKTNLVTNSSELPNYKTSLLRATFDLELLVPVQPCKKVALFNSQISKLRRELLSITRLELVILIK